MKKAEVWETAILFLSIISLWPIVVWYNSKTSVPPYYILILIADLGVLVLISVRRIKRLRDAIRESKNRR